MARTITAAMPLFNVGDVRAGLAPNQRLIGLDPGTRVIGVALSDVTCLLATPWGAVRRGKLGAVAAELLAIGRAEGVGGLVVGWPLSMDGTMGPAAQAARDWALALSDVTGWPAAMWDERLSSSAVNRFLIGELDATRRKRAAVVDSMAAAYILQSALDASRPPPAAP